MLGICFRFAKPWHGGLWALTLAFCLLVSSSSRAEEVPDLDLFFRAVTDGRASLVQSLLKDNPEWVHAEMFSGIKPLYRATVLGRTEVAELLLESGAEVNAITLRGTRPIHAAASAGHGDLVGLLIASGADVDSRDGEGTTPLYMAARVGRSETVQRLLAAKASPDLATVRGRTPLHESALAGHLRIVQALVEAGADVNVIDARGDTPLDLAQKSWRNQAEAVRIYLRQNGAVFHRVKLEEPEYVQD